MIAVTRVGEYVYTTNMNTDTSGESVLTCVSRVQDSQAKEKKKSETEIILYVYYNGLFQVLYQEFLTNSIAYGSRRFNASFTRTPQ